MEQLLYILLIIVLAPVAVGTILSTIWLLLFIIVGVWSIIEDKIK